MSSTAVRAGWGHSWSWDILPYIEQQPLYNVIIQPISDSGAWTGTDARSLALIRTARTSVKTFRCPSDPAPNTESQNVNGLTNRATSNYLACAGGNATNDNIATGGMVAMASAHSPCFESHWSGAASAVLADCPPLASPTVATSALVPTSSTCSPPGCARNQRANSTPLMSGS